MTIQELLAGGELARAIEAQTAEVKSNPLDPDRRYLLFALLGFAGDWGRAENQLDALGHQDPKLEVGSRIYRHLIASEKERQEVFREGGEPLLPPGAPAHLKSRLEALGAARQGDVSQAEQKIEEAISSQPELSGHINEIPFTAVRDQDDLLGSVCEIHAGGHYLWLPFEQIRRLEVDPPRHLLDLLWLPARLEDVDGVEATVHLPVLYEGSALSEDGKVKLGRVTAWQDLGGGIFRGLGQRLLTYAGEDGQLQELPFQDLRTLELDSSH